MRVIPIFSGSAIRQTVFRSFGEEHRGRALPTVRISSRNLSGQTPDSSGGPRPKARMTARRMRLPATSAVPKEKTEKLPPPPDSRAAPIGLSTSVYPQTVSPGRIENPKADIWNESRESRATTSGNQTEITGQFSDCSTFH